MSHAARPSVDKSSRVGRVLEDLQDGRNGGFLPDEVSEAIPPRQGEVMTVEGTQHLARRSEAQKGGKDQLQAILDLLMGILVDPINGVTDKAHRQGEGKFASLRFVEESRGHACPNGVQFQLRELSFQSQE